MQDLSTVVPNLERAGIDLLSVSIVIYVVNSFRSGVINGSSFYVVNSEIQPFCLTFTFMRSRSKVERGHRLHQAKIGGEFRKNWVPRN